MDKSRTFLRIISTASCLLIAACGSMLPENDLPGRHINNIEPDSVQDASIPAVVNPAPLLSPPKAAAEEELYTIVAQDVPVRELLFTMARDAAINVDVHPDVTGLVTINAINQSLPQILERVARQSDIRWHFDDSGNMVVAPDSPDWRTYKIDYVNVARTSETLAEVSTSIVSSIGTNTNQTGGSNNSTSSLTQSSTNSFWATLTDNLVNLIKTPGKEEDDIASSIVINSEAGIVTVRATARQHEQIAGFINNVQTRSLYQVLIEATIVEVNLNDNFQSGVDWSTVGRNSGDLSFVQNLTGANLENTPSSVFTLDAANKPDAINATISLLSQFGELKVLSSPKIMTLNNQSAMLRVVDNTVYFTIDVQPGIAATAVSPATQPTYTTNVHTVPVGFVMTVTPQVGEADQVTLNVRPTISRILRFVNDPSPILAEANVVNSVPEIQVRELEAVLKVYSGQIAILGGLMQDSLSSDVDGLPGLSRVPFVRNFFSYRAEKASKTELIVFIRPVVIRQPSVNADLYQYNDYLPTSAPQTSALIQPGQLPAANGK